MKFMSVRDFRLNTGQMRRGLDQDEEVVLTANGKPFVIVSSIRPEAFDKELRAIRCARAKLALDRTRDSAVKGGTAEMPLPEINKIISDTRRRKVRA